MSPGAASRLLGALLLALALGGPAAAQEDIAYVTDQLRLGLYAGSGDSGERLRLLASGDALTVLERRGNYARVRTEDGLEGWVKRAFLVSEKPAALQLRDLQAEAETLRRRIQRLEEELRAVRDPDIRQRLERTAAELEQARGELSRLQAENAELRAQTAPVARLKRNAWVAWAGGAGLTVLALGMLLGYRLHQRRVRRRFSGLSLD